MVPENAWASRLDDFRTLSQFLTGRDYLDEALAEQFFAALTKRSVTFEAAFEKLVTAIALLKPASIDVFNFDALALGDQYCARAIISAWYSGVVGTSADAIVISFDGALLYDASRDALSIPSYCDGGPAVWVVRPPAAPDSGARAAVAWPSRIR